MDLTIISITSAYVDRVVCECKSIDVMPLLLTSLGFFNTGEIFTRIMIDAEYDTIEGDDNRGSALWIANSLLKSIVNDNE